MKLTSPAFGLDTLHFYLSASQVTFRPDFECTVQPGGYNPATGEIVGSYPLWRRADGVEVVGAYAYLNTENYQLTIRPDRERGTSVVTVHFSARAFSDTNLNPLGCDACGEMALRVQSDLAGKGALMNLIRDGRISRLDAALNVKLAEPVANYSPVLVGAGMGRRVSKTDFGGTGFIAGNVKRDRWQLALYDKGAQMKKNHYALDLCPDKTLRAELRLMKSGVIRERLPLAETTLAAVQSNWKFVALEHQKALQKHLFRRLPQDKRACSIDAQVLLQMGADSSRPVAKSGTFALWALLLGQYGLDGARNLICSEWGHLSRQALDGHVASLEAAHSALHLAGESPSGRVLWVLYEELREKLLCLSQT